MFNQGDWFQVINPIVRETGRGRVVHSNHSIFQVAHYETQEDGVIKYYAKNGSGVVYEFYSTDPIQPYIIPVVGDLTYQTGDVINIEGSMYHIDRATPTKYMTTVPHTQRSWATQGVRGEYVCTKEGNAEYFIFTENKFGDLVEY